MHDHILKTDLVLFHFTRVVCCWWLLSCSRGLKGSGFVPLLKDAPPPQAIWNENPHTKVTCFLGYVNTIWLHCVLLLLLQGFKQLLQRTIQRTTFSRQIYRVLYFVLTSYRTACHAILPGMSSLVSTHWWNGQWFGDTTHQGLQHKEPVREHSGGKCAFISTQLNFSLHTPMGLAMTCRFMSKSAQPFQQHLKSKRKKGKEMQAPQRDRMQTCDFSFSVQKVQLNWLNRPTANI